MWIYEKGIVEKFSIRRRKRREAMDEWLKTRDLPLHFISVAGLVYKGDEVLLIKSKRRGWEIPGGVVEQGEDIMSGLKREIFEESGIVVEPEKFVGIYQRLNTKDGYGPLEGMILPPVVNLTFICKYIDGNENVSDESIEVGWFTPNIAKEKITVPDIKKRVCDMLEFDGKHHFSTFENKDSKIKFISDMLVK